MDALVLGSDNSALAADCRAEMKEGNRKMLRLKPHERQERRRLQTELRRLAREEKQRHRKAIDEVLGAARVVAW